MCDAPLLHVLAIIGFLSTAALVSFVLVKIANFVEDCSRTERHALAALDKATALNLRLEKVERQFYTLNSEVNKKIKK